MEQEIIEGLVQDNLKRIGDKLKLGLEKEQLVRTGHYRQKKICK